MADLDFLAPYLDKDVGAPPESPGIYEEVYEEAPPESAVEQAKSLRLLLDAGLDVDNKPIVYKVFGEPTIGEGFIGGVGGALERATREDIIPKEVEQLLEPKYLKLLEEYYGSPEVSVPRADADLLERIRTSIMGRTPTASETEAERLASLRGGVADFPTRYILEKFGGVIPSKAAIEGAAGPDASPAERALLAKFGYRPVTDRATQEVELKHYARLPLRDPEKFKALTENANQALRWMAEVPAGETADGEKYSVVEDVVGEILLTDINQRYGTAEKQYTLEDLKLRMEPSAAGGKRLTFMHPDGEGRQAIDPVTLDWGDALDQLPGAYVILGDVLGSIGGGFAGAPVGGPAGIFAGATAGGALGAMAAKYLVMKKGLDIGGFEYDRSKGGFVSQKSGKQQVIPLSSFWEDVVTEGMWSAGGAALGSALFRLGRGFFTRGASEAEYFVRKEDWDDAYRRWGQNKFGKKFKEEGIPTSPSFILESAARELSEAAEKTTGKEADRLRNQAARMNSSATQFRTMEKSLLPEAAVARERMLGSLEEGTRTIDGKVIKPANYDDPEVFGREVEAAIRSGDGTRIKRLLESMSAANQKLIDDWDAAFEGVAGEGTEAVFGRSIREAANRALGLVDGKTASRTDVGIYGSLNNIRNRTAIYNRPKAWNVQEASQYVEKEIRGLGGEFKGIAGPFSKELKGLFNSLRNRAKDKKIAVNYGEMRQLIDMVDNEIKQASGGNARRLFHLQEILKKAEGRGIKNVDDDLHKEWIVAQDQLKAFKSIWAKQFERGLTDLNTDKLADKFLRSMNDDKTISEVLGNFRGMGLYGKEQEDLLRNVLKSRLRHALTRELDPKDAVEIAGRAQTVKIGDNRFARETVSGAKFNQFLNEYGPWVRQLFLDDPQLEQFAQKVARDQTLKGRYDKIARIEKDLKQLPFLQKYPIEDLQRLALDEPQKLYDLIWQSGRSSVENTKSIKEVNRILKRGLEPEEYALAQTRLKALTLRKIWNPTDEFAAASKSGQTVSPRDVTINSLDFLNRERSALIEVFGEKHVNNMHSLFKEMHAAANPVDVGTSGYGSAAARYLDSPLRQGSGFLQDLRKLPGLAAKVWVGVLNRKARTLNLGKKLYESGEERAFARLLSDPVALDRALKIRGSTVNRITANALGSILLGSEAGIAREDEIQRLLNNYTMTDSQGRLQPVPMLTEQEARSETLETILEPPRRPLEVHMPIGLIPPEQRGIPPEQRGGPDQ